MKFNSFENLIDKVNNDLKQFEPVLTKFRKKVTPGCKSKGYIFGYEKSSENWTINYGGTKYVQFHISYQPGDQKVAYGLGFCEKNSFSNPNQFDDIKPFFSAFKLLKNKYAEFNYIYGNDNEYDDGYVLFGKIIDANNNNISDSDYSKMIDEIQTSLFELYKEIWEYKDKIIMGKIDCNSVELMNDYVRLIKNVKNLILTGAPGTGKTFLANNIAAKIMFGVDNYEDLDKEEKRQIGYVQFHSSYDYTDFVEGLRPIKKSDSIGFERQDGIFKDFCIKALNYSTQNKDTDNHSFENKISLAFDELIDKIIETTDGGGNYELKLRGGNSDGEITADSNKNVIYIKPKNGKRDDPYTVRKKGIMDLSNYYKSSEALDALPNLHKAFKSHGYGSKSSYYYAVLKEIYSNIGDVNPTKEQKQTRNTGDFVFVIDEINRGEVSRIFGELFNAIEPGYRGDKRPVMTQYSNLIESDEYFSTGFYVPENVYIIGTMNDIDRSVESMDFAFRRRFAWKEIKAKDTQYMLDSNLDKISNTNDFKLKINDEEVNIVLKFPDDIFGLMDSLNDAIWKKSENSDSGDEFMMPSSAYHIGAAYFLKLNDYANEQYPFNALWNYHLEPLLCEYLRGVDNSSDYMDKFAKSYFGYLKAKKRVI